MSQPIFFNEIDSESANEIFDYWSTHSVSVVVKLNGKFAKTKSYPEKNQKLLKLEKFAFSPIAQQSVLCCVQINDNRFYFKAKLSNSADDCFIEEPGKVYQLFRRNNFRVSMPVGYQYKCNVIYHKGKKTNFPIELRDLSLGGCQLSIGAGMLSLNKDDELDISLKIDRFDFSKLSLNARHIQEVSENHTVLIGASFFDPDAEMTAELQAMLMHLDRIHRKKIYD